MAAYQESLVQTFFSLCVTFLVLDPDLDDGPAQGCLQSFFQGFQLDETVHSKNKLRLGVRCHLQQFGFIGVFDSDSKNCDTSTTESDCRFAHIILGFTVCDYHRYLRDILPAALFLSEDVFQGEV